MKTLLSGGRGQPLVIDAGTGVSVIDTESLFSLIGEEGGGYLYFTNQSGSVAVMNVAEGDSPAVVVRAIIELLRDP